MMVWSSRSMSRRRASIAPPAQSICWISCRPPDDRSLLRLSSSLAASGGANGARVQSLNRIESETIKGEESMAKSNNRSGGRNDRSGGVMDMARERPVAAAAAAVGAAAAGLFLWSRRTQISNQLSDLSDQFGEWTENMRWGDTGGSFGGESTGGGSSFGGTSSTTTSRGRSGGSTTGGGRGGSSGMSETGGGNANLGARSGGGGTTASASGRGRARSNPTS